jgi:predicted PurR-regulated permease PerM
VAQQVVTTDARERAAAAWRALAARLRTVTPAGIGRIAGVLAYAVLPVVDRLDRFMPRALAGLLAILVILGALGAFIAVVAPPVVGQLVKLFLDLPTGERLADVGQRVQAWLVTLPEGSRTIATEVIDRVVTILRADLSGSLDGLAAVIADTIVHAFDALSVILGLLVIPTWILAVTRDTPAGRRRLADHIAPWLRPDLLALVRIVDEVASSFRAAHPPGGLGPGRAPHAAPARHAAA